MLKTTIVESVTSLIPRMSDLKQCIDRVKELNPCLHAHVSKGSAFLGRRLNRVDRDGVQVYVVEICAWNKVYDWGNQHLGTVEFSFDITKPGDPVISITSEEEYHGRAVAIVLSNLLGEIFAEAHFSLFPRRVSDTYSGHYVKNLKEMELFECIFGSFVEHPAHYPAIVERSQESVYGHSQRHGAIDITIKRLKGEIAFLEGLKEEFK